MIRSRIDSADVVHNKSRRFGSLRNYQPAVVVQCGHESRALFTVSQIRAAIERYKKNREDWPVDECRG